MRTRRYTPGETDLPDMRNAEQLASYRNIECKRAAVVQEMIETALEEHFADRVRHNVVNRISKSFGMR